MEFVKLFEPIDINGLSIKNRIVMPAMALFYTDDYSLTERYKAFYLERAKGGVGLMIIGPVAIDRVGSSPFILGLFDDSHIDPFLEYIDLLHKTTDVKIGIQLMQQGRNASEQMTGMKPIAPSAIANPLSGELPRAMTKEDIEEVKDAYVKAAMRARSAGFDYMEILTGGSYLIGEFLSPVTNHRSDEYGGSVENRMRFGLEVITQVRNAVGKDFPMGIRVSGQDFVKGGNTLAESSLFCIAAEKAGVDAINVTGGWHETTVPQVTSEVPPGAYLYLARAIREKVGVSVFASNRLGDPSLAEKALRSGAADMICWGRPLIADPDLPTKVLTGRQHERVPCIGCNQGCIDAIFAGSRVCCTLNPRAGREAETEIREADVKKRIFVAGGGPAGMEFALIAGQRGHDVTLYEKDNKLGGQINLIGPLPGKSVYLEAVTSLENRLKSSNVKIKLNTPLTPEIIESEASDLLVVATGAKPAKLNIPGIDGPNVINAWDVLCGAIADIGKRVVVIGGGAIGCETAMLVANLGVPTAETFSFLAYHRAVELEQLRSLLYNSGRKITIIVRAERPAKNVGISTRWVLLKNLKLMGVDIRTKTKILDISEGYLRVETENGTESIPADTIILAAGSMPVNDLARAAPSNLSDVLVIGDAKAIGKISDAVKDGFDMALRV
ncbi:Predicted NADH:flavin oxidoreductase/NADH oxidase [Syntrophobacter sp. SbD1]|nr:Predicted NADH:flavin oxidoreductase/NADH oxidase [Syntrophobacter sp. SbD1]